MSIVLSCPSCSTRYRADPQSIGAGGRRVRCASCGHVWTAEAEIPTVSAADQAASAQPDPAAVEAAKKPHKAFRERQEKKRHTLSVAAAGGAWGGLVAACALLLACSWVFRVDIVTLWPRASSAYAAVGAQVNPYGFTVGELDIHRDVDHGVPLLVIEGDIHNFDRRARAVPGLHAILRDAHGASVLEWTVSMPAGHVPAGRRRDFRTVVSDPPPDAVEVEVVLMAQAATGNTLPHDEDAGHEPDEPDHGQVAEAHGAPAEQHAAPSHAADTAHAPANDGHGESAGGHH